MAGRSDFRLGVIFLGLVLIPSGLLGYFSWLALKNEKLLAQQRLSESYQRLARLAANEFDEELSKLEQRWINALKIGYRTFEKTGAFAAFDSLLQADDVVKSGYYFSAPGKLLYPEAYQLKDENWEAAAQPQDAFITEAAWFEKEIARAEDFELTSSRFDSSYQIYANILEIATSEQLKAIAQSHLGRILLRQKRWNEAENAFTEILQNHAEMRDLRGMYLGFLARYQLAVCYEGMGRFADALEMLLTLHQDLLDRSDAIHSSQFSDFFEQISAFAPGLIEKVAAGRRAHYESSFASLAEQGKQQVSQKYFVAVLNRKLQKTIVDRKRFRKKFRYYAGSTAEGPYLLACRYMPDSTETRYDGLMGVQIDLTTLQTTVVPEILKNLDFDEDAHFRLETWGQAQSSSDSLAAQSAIAEYALKAPFDFWKVAIYVDNEDVGFFGRQFGTTLGLWFISILILSILAGVWVFARKAQREAKLSRMKSTFVSNLSHELRTPLTSIRMLAELLEMQLEKTSGEAVQKVKQKGGQYLGVILRESDRLNRLIDNLLDFSRIERGAKSYQFVIKNPADILRAAIDAFRPQAEANGFKMNVSVAEDLPAVKVDADAMSQVILNLLSNAVKYSDDRKVIEVRTRHDARQVQIEVADQGVGMPRTELKKIFNSFYRIDDALNTQKQGGVGIGLTLVRQIVEDHQGSVNVTSDLGAGSVFTVSLPAAETI